MSGKTFKRIVLMLVIFFLPFSFFYFFSLGSHHFGKLPFLGPDVNGSPFVYDNFTFTASSSDQQSFYGLNDKIIIATNLSSDCPNSCDIAAKELHFMVYKELIKEEKFKDVVIISELRDSVTSPSDMSEKLEVDPEKWIVYHTDDHSLWDVELDGKVLSAKEDPDRKGKYLYTNSILLIDKSKRLRGYYVGSQTIELKRLLDELRLLTKEYETNN